MIFFGAEFREYEVGWSLGVCIHFLDEYARREAYTDRFFVIELIFGPYQLDLFIEDKKMSRKGVKIDE